jgi:prepilin-type N-terminal cleavage/methylation domain-containing protein
MRTACIGRARKNSGGFTLLETMIVMAVLLIVMAAVFQQIGDAQARSATEQSRLDLFQEAREFLDQMTRDLKDTGYPNQRNYSNADVTSMDSGSGLYQKDANMSAGLLKVDANYMRFESLQPKQDGSGSEVHVIEYSIVPYSDSNPNCPCLQRAENIKSTGNSVSQTLSPSVEVQNVMNISSGTPLFKFFQDSGAEVPLPAAIDDLATASILTNITAIEVTIQVMSPYADLKTGQKPVMTLVSATRVHNCSPSVLDAATPGAMSCAHY